MFSRLFNLGTMKATLLILITFFINISYSADISTINLSWSTVAFQSEYALHLHLDEPLDDGRVVIEGCIGADILGLSTHVVFSGTCPAYPELGNIPLSTIQSFEIEVATYGDWDNIHGRQRVILENQDLDLLRAKFPPFKINQTDTYVYVLAGQSNMSGMARYRPILDKLNPTGNKIPDNVEYYVDGKRVFEFSIDSWFGPEVSFTNHIARKYPYKNIIILKYAPGGSDIGRWLAPNGITDELITKAVEVIGNRMVAIKAILWMQGETDVFLESNTYKKDLKQLIEKLRKASVAGGRARSLPFILGRVHNYTDDDPRFEPALKTVRNDQYEVAIEDDFSYIINTDHFIEGEDDDGQWHFDGQSQLSFGQCLFNAVENLTELMDCPLLSTE
jgi:hypothetical protein